LIINADYGDFLVYWYFLFIINRRNIDVFAELFLVVCNVRTDLMFIRVGKRIKITIKKEGI